MPGGGAHARYGRNVNYYRLRENGPYLKNSPQPSNSLNQESAKPPTKIENLYVYIIDSQFSQSSGISQIWNNKLTSGIRQISNYDLETTMTTSLTEPYNSQTSGINQTSSNNPVTTMTTSPAEPGNSQT
ncbi:hypothetical protein J6590_075238 [Homalodisca vitripennis]|nr:hypothetical protein J6590_075238 [Homalodisca vitripennis]